MALAPPSNFVRLKYRPKPVHPELDEGQADYGATHSVAKKVKPEEVDDLAELRELRFRPAIMFPGHTQNKRVESTVVSDDKTYRSEMKPTLFERVEQQKVLLKKQLREEEQEIRRMERKEELRQRLAKVLAESVALSPEEIEKARMETEKNKGSDGEDGESKDDDANLAKEQIGSGMTQEEMALTSLNENDLALMDPEELADYRETCLELKEKRVLRARNPVVYHRVESAYYRRMLALKLFFGFGKQEREMTEILPWMLLGRVEPAQNMYGLTKLGVTHILNVTKEEPNLFPLQFVYLKVPVRDEMEENIGEFFQQAIEFFKRVESKRGKIYIHCSAGISRAPTMAIVYLIALRNISLNDAYAYVKARRPLIQINDHFLFQLAELEIAQGHGSSVTNHKDFMFYEFNRIRSDIEEIRSHNGLFFTTLSLYRKREDDDIL